MFGRYSHLIRALDKRPTGLQDTLVEERIDSLRVWNHARFLVSVLLSLGVIATAGAWVAKLLPAFATAIQALDHMIATTGTFTGLLTLLYLFLTRLLGQLEIDILTLLTIEH